MKHPTGSYIDEKGRMRWRVNDWMGERLQELHDILVIGGYDPSHAARYPKLAHDISRYPEPIDALAREGRLGEITGIGTIVAEIIVQTLTSGESDKLREWAQNTPTSVVELTAIPGIGAKTVRMLYAEHGIDSLDALRSAIASGRLTRAPGIGPKTTEAMRRYLTEHC